MPKPISASVRAAITEDIAAGQKSRNQIARDHKVSVGSVTNIAHAAGLTEAFDRSETKQANAAAQIDHTAALAVLARRHVKLASSVLDSFEAMTITDWRKVSPHTRGVVLGIASDKARELAPSDDEARNEAAKSLLGALLSDVVDKHGDA